MRVTGVTGERGYAPTMSRKRLDALLAERGLYETRSRAAAAVLAGDVRIGEERRPAEKPGQMVTDDVAVELAEVPQYVSRGGQKLANALAAFDFDPGGRSCFDVGASTGGFTEVCLRRGAARVYAVDVGQGQLHPRLAADARVVNLERTDARALTAAEIPRAPDLIVCDASFIGLAKVLPAALSLAARGADLVTLVKPQFEAARPGGTKKGVVRDASAREAALAAVSDWLTGQGWAVQATAVSPIPGGDGNVEYLLWARRRG